MHYVYYTFKNDEPIKGYVGMTIHPINDKWKYKGSGVILKNSFKKYGKRNFTRIDLGEYFDKEEAHYWEGFYIKLFQTLKCENGYNISPIGGLGSSASWNEDMKEKLRGKNNPRYSEDKRMKELLIKQKREKMLKRREKILEKSKKVKFLFIGYGSTSY
jgi:hypothetical protein